MTTIKSYTDLQQSKKLTEILPVESADMFYVYDRHLAKLYGDTPYVIGYKALNESIDVPCWSLAALLDLIPQRLFDDDGFSYYIRITKGMGLYYITYLCDDEELYHPVNVGCMNTLVDACYEIIIKLHEQNIL